MGAQREIANVVGVEVERNGLSVSMWYSCFFLYLISRVPAFDYSERQCKC